MKQTAPGAPTDGMYTFRLAGHFKEWMHGLDKTPMALVAARIATARRGRLGKPLKGTDGIYEMSVDTGPGFRLYYCQTGKTAYLLLTGGTKDGQQRDIKRAMEMHERLKGGERV